MSQPLTENAIYETFRGIVAKSLRVDSERITMEASLIELGAESLDLIEITMECESAFDICMHEKKSLHTAREVFGENIIEQEGRITEIGKRMLADRIRPADSALLEGDLTVAEVERYFMRVGAWVTLLTNLVGHRPTQCDQCGGTLK